MHYHYKHSKSSKTIADEIFSTSKLLQMQREGKFLTAGQKKRIQQFAENQRVRNAAGKKKKR